MVERVFVVGDLHGQHNVARRLLEAAGIVDKEGARIRDPSVGTVQLGDLINGTRSSLARDAATLRKARAWFDVCLVGNHDYPYLGGYGFGGFWRSMEIERLALNVFWHPALAVGGTLLTHAGVADLLGMKARTAKEAEMELVEAWLADRGHPFFALCSPARAGGRDYVGGVLWKDWSEPRSTRFSQVHGHTPQDGPVFVGDRDGVYCANIDVGARSGRVCGVWLDADGRPGEVVEAFVKDSASATDDDQEESET